VGTDNWGIGGESVKARLTRGQQLFLFMGAALTVGD